MVDLETLVRYLTKSQLGLIQEEVTLYPTGFSEVSELSSRWGAAVTVSKNTPSFAMFPSGVGPLRATKRQTGVSFLNSMTCSVHSFLT